MSDDRGIAERKELNRTTNYNEPELKQ